MAADDLGFNLGNAILGGDIDREGARLEGLDLGSKIQSRKATTVNALAQARLRVDEAEAKVGLADAIEEMGLPREAAVHLRAGGTLADLAKGLGGQQERGFRDTIADVNIPFEQRQASAQAVEGKVVDPFQSVGTGLVADVFDPGAGVTVAPTGEANIAATQALEKQRLASAALSDERRLHPDRFKASTNISLTTGGLAEDVLPGGVGTSIIPDDINAEEAFGAEAFFKGGVNALSDFIGAGTQFPDEAQANEVLGNLSARTQIVLRADVPGGRPPVIVQELLGRYAEDPRQLFRGDDIAVQRLETTTAALRQLVQRTKDKLNSPTKKTPTRQGKLEDALLAAADLVADYERILQSIKNTGGDQATDAGSLEVGGSFTSPDGTVTIRRTN